MSSGSVLPSTINPSSWMSPSHRCRVDCVDAFGPFLEFFGFDPLILAAASERSPSGPQRLSPEEQCRDWVHSLFVEFRKPRDIPIPA